jgi:hypothetical protein
MPTLGYLIPTLCYLMTTLGYLMATLGYLMPTLGYSLHIYRRLYKNALVLFKYVYKLLFRVQNLQI